MIVTRLHGRLGNQMFQFAAGFGLARRLGVGLALDTRIVMARGEGVLTRVFNLSLEPARSLPPDRARAPVRYALWRGMGLAPRLRRERGLGYNPAFETWGDESYLHGYWQAEPYFSAVADALRREFLFPAFSDVLNRAMADRIQSCLSVSLHVRRGDYVALGAHGLCDRVYYEAALAKIVEGLAGEPTVFVFSDDPGWAREHLPLPFERVIVDFNGADRDFEDMRLMSLCRHNVIANSSFSWWSAWLNAHADKRVAAPARWFADGTRDNPDILPPGWLRIDAA